MNAEMMNAVKTRKTYKPLSLPSEQVFPTAPFPRKYVHSVFNDLPDAVQAVLTLLAADFEARDIHILASREYLEAVERGQTLLGSLTSMDLDEYLQEASRGRFILVMRPSSYEQIMQVRNLLAPHHAHLMKYIDTWTTVDLIP